MRGEVLEYESKKILAIDGEDANGHFATSLSSSIDFNGDGFHDFIAGALKAGRDNEGMAFLFLGGNPLEVTRFSRSVDVVLSGDENGDYFGWGLQ